MLKEPCEPWRLSREAIVAAIQQTIEIKAAKYGAFDVNCEAIADAILALPNPPEPTME